MHSQGEAATTKAKSSTVGKLPAITDKTNTPVSKVHKFEEIPITDIIPKDKEVNTLVEEPVNELSSVRESEAANLIVQEAGTGKLPQLSDTILSAS